MAPDKSNNTGSRRPKAKTGSKQNEVLVLSRISAALSGLWDLDAILGVGLDSTLEIMNGTIGEILLIDEETQTLVHRVYRGYSKDFMEKIRLSLGEGITGSVAQSGKAILLEDISSDSRVAHREMVVAEGLKAFICVPLRAKDKVLGVLNVASDLSHRFTTNDMQLLYAIGDQLGIAIEQARLYERLRMALERYRRLARQTLVAEEEERRRLARELHDETSQALSGLALQLQALVDMVKISGSQDEEFKNRLIKVQTLVVQVHSEISRLIANLRPALLDTLGLIPAIRRYAENSLNPLGINVTVETAGTEKRLPSEVDSGLFRWVQGAIGNIAQHSKAKNATILLDYQEDELFLRVTDDGQGFDVSKITNIEDSGRGRGVFSMKERVGLLGGICQIESQPGQGTTLWARVPVNWDGEDAKNKSARS